MSEFSYGPIISRGALAIRFAYTNYKGVKSIRTATPYGSPSFASNEWHPTPQWLICMFDHDKQEPRLFALADCDFTITEEVSETSSPDDTELSLQNLEYMQDIHDHFALHGTTDPMPKRSIGQQTSKNTNKADPMVWYVDIGDLDDDVSKDIIDKYRREFLRDTTPPVTATETPADKPTVVEIFDSLIDDMMAAVDGLRATFAKPSVDETRKMSPSGPATVTQITACGCERDEANHECHIYGCLDDRT